MTHTLAADINGTMKSASTTNNTHGNHSLPGNGYVDENQRNQEFGNAVPLDVDQQKDYVYKMHNYCCNPVKLKQKCDENHQKLLLKKKQLGSAKRKIKLLKNKVALLQDVIKNMKQNGHGNTNTNDSNEHKSL